MQPLRFYFDRSGESWKPDRSRLPRDPVETRTGLLNPIKSKPLAKVDYAKAVHPGFSALSPFSRTSSGER